MSAPASPNSPPGVLFNVLGSTLFALLYAYTSLLQPLSGEAIYGWRMLMTFPCLTVLLLLTGHGHEVRRIAGRLFSERYFWAQRLLSAALLGTQLWLFMWAPVNGYGLDVSLGYFLLPISMVVVGRLAFRDRISRLQGLACGLATVGVVCQIVIAGAVSWPALLVCLGYPGYFWLRRVTDTNNPGALWFDMAIGLPVSLFFVLKGGQWLPPGSPSALPWLILGLGILSASALGFQALSAPRLNLALFGLLIYVEPVLLVLVALLLGESIAPSQWPTYLAIWLAVLVLIAEGVSALHQTRGPGALARAPGQT